jgi:hypothetical protein
MATPKFERLIHNVKNNTMVYRFYDLVDVPEDINLVGISQKYSNDLTVKTWIDYLQSHERELKMEFTGGKFDAVRMKAVLMIALQNSVNNAIEYLASLQNFLAKEEADEQKRRDAVLGIEDEPIIGDVAESSEIIEPAPQEPLEPPAPQEPLEPPAPQEPLEETPVTNSRPKNKKR